MQAGYDGLLDDKTRPSRVTVPAGIVELKHDALVGPGANRFGKIGEMALANRIGRRLISHLL